MNESIPLNATWHLRAELSHLLALLAAHLDRQRRRGRSPAGDIVRGMVIEEGEAEGLIAQLASDWDDARASMHRRAHQRPSRNDPVASLAETACRQGVFLPLRHARRRFELRSMEYHALLLALSAELDPGFGRLYAYLNDHVGRTRPTLGLALSLGAGDEDFNHALAPEILCRPFVQDGLLKLEGDAPLPSKDLLLAADIIQRVTSDAPQAPDSDDSRFFPVEPGLLDRLVLSADLRKAIAAWSDRLRKRAGKSQTLLLIGSPGSGRATLARAALSAAGRHMIAVRISADNPDAALTIARRDARWYEAGVLIEVNIPDIRWRAVWSNVSAIQGPVMIAVTPDIEHIALKGAPKNASRLSIEPPDAGLRKRLWQSLAPPGENMAEDTAAELATLFRFEPGRIDQTIQRARADLALQPEEVRKLTCAALKRAARTVGSAAMGHLAQRLPCPYRPEDLVVQREVQIELDLALAWARNQHTVLCNWGFERRMPYGWGLRALFSGPPGTGKTMAAQVLARQLDLDLYRVDLSRTVSKYIGETEKNLARLFDEAHRSGALLFFDEADALFGKRSEVKDAHDRYANIEIGYLLQRMETHDGIVILASNRRQDMDEAFVRRFDFMIDFPMPNAAERLRIWQGMFPEAAERSTDLQLEPVAHRFELSGGEIRNIALASAYMAAGESLPIGMTHIIQALRREMIKNGRVVDQADIDALK